ncbi:hypothetical protein [Paenarthrobacter nitroguajacolicus]|uniref:hypothetical protein n=1 Tax=Paenarthrobacter nitroguajacolicus TaxID=211146 RepID=UPI00248C2F59|nr:hypothetical protein [Paenarthrobacter nitroguajacolicus]MDI2033284.1 hypothetical protein [Paenarthrobacter nitroguajacolicus]
MKNKSDKKAILSKRVAPEWYYWTGVIIPGILMLVLCVNRTEEFGISVWIANAIVLIASALGIGFATYWKSNFAATLSFGATIILGSLAFAALSNVIPVIGLTGGALWTGCPLGLLVGLTLTAGEER